MNKINLHLNIANLLLESIAETSLEWKKSDNKKYPYVGQPPEHSRESVIRRCIQVRQELLHVVKELRKL